MGLEGRKVSDNMVMFGEPLNERALKALQTRSPTADSIISSLPPSAFIPIQESMKIVEPEEVKPEEVKVDKAKTRREKKKLKFKQKKQKAKQTIEENIEIKEKTILNTLIENNIKENIKENDSSNLIEEKENKMDLEKELEALSAKAQPKVQEEVVEVQEEQTPQADLRDQIMSLLGNEPNAPTMEHIEAWKEHYGKSGIHVMAFGEGEVYIYHHLTRGEWKKLKELMARLQESENADEIEEQLKEKVVMHCILWPSVDANWLDKCKAGVIDSLYQMILLNSGFLTPQQAMLLTTQL
jgi:hypothetical protein